jgi:cation transport ATPase
MAILSYNIIIANGVVVKILNQLKKVNIQIAAVGLLSPILAAAAIALSSISVIANSSLLKRIKIIGE